MSETKTPSRSLAKGLLAGLIGGLAATAVKSLAEKILPAKPHGEPQPSIMLAEKLVGHELVGVERTAALETIHWGFGALTGAAYGALAEYYPQATVKDGAGFGMTLSSLTSGPMLPAMGLAVETPEEQTTFERGSAMATLVVFGIVTETVRRSVRKILR